MLTASTCVFAQGNRVSVMLRQLNEPLHDTTKINLCYAISRYYWFKNTDSVILMAQRGIELAEAIQFKKGKALNSLSMGVGLNAKGNYPEALKYHLESLKLSEELKLEGLSGNVYSNIAIIYLDYGNTGKAIEYFNKALHIAEKYGETGTAPALINLSDLYTKTGEYETAMRYATRALTISRSQGDSSNIAISLFNISEVFKKTDRIDSAQWYVQRSESISRRIYDDEGISYCLNSLADIMADKGRYREGIRLARNSLSILERVKNKELTMGANHTLYLCYSGLGDFEQALNYRNEEIAIKEYMLNIERQREASNLINQYNLERKELQIELLEKDKAIQQKEIDRVSLVKTIYGTGATLLALLAGYLIVSNLRWKNYNRIVRERNTLIQEQKSTIIKQKIHSERLNAVKDKIISIISHDFRSPLHTLHSFLQLLKQDLLTKEEISDATLHIDHSLESTMGMIDNLLTWGSNQMSGMTLNQVTFDIRELVHDNLQLILPRAECKKVTIINRIEKPTLVFGDRETTNIVLRNLITNSIKFSRPNDSILISAEEEENRTVISVKDTGVGIAPERLNSLFDGSLNVTTVGTANEKGTGLGLALCQELVHQNGGEIWVESTQGEGSTFSFSIPRGPIS